VLDTRLLGLQNLSAGFKSPDNLISDSIGPLLAFVKAVVSGRGHAVYKVVNPFAQILLESLSCAQGATSQFAKLLSTPIARLRSQENRCRRTDDRAAQQKTNSTRKVAVVLHCFPSLSIGDFVPPQGKAEHSLRYGLPVLR
jgi:hypothetical protein